MRKPNPDEELKAFKDLLWHVDLHRRITMDHAAVVAALDRMSAWVSAHSDGNGERSEEEVEANVVEAFWKYIAQRKAGLPPPKRGPGRPRKNPLPEES